MMKPQNRAMMKYVVPEMMEATTEAHTKADIKKEEWCAHCHMRCCQHCQIKFSATHVQEQHANNEESACRCWASEPPMPCRRSCERQ